MSEVLERLIGPLRRALAGRASHDIGLHIGLERVNLVQLKPGRPRPAVRAVASIAHGSTQDALVADPALLKSLLKRAFASHPFRGNRVVTCLPNDQIRIVQLSYTLAEGASETDTIIRELRERVQADLDGMVVDFVRLRQEHPSRPKEAIVAMATREKVTAYLDRLTACGLEVASLDIAPAALARVLSWISATDPHAGSNLLLINFGVGTSYLTVVWGRRLIIDRSIEFAERRLLARLENILDIPAATGKRLLLERGFGDGGRGDAASEISDNLKEVLRPEFLALKTEVENTLVYTASRTHGRTVDTIYVVGSIARYPGIEHLLREQFALPLKVLDPLSIFSHQLSARELKWLWPRSGVAAATGLALRGVPLQWPKST